MAFWKRDRDLTMEEQLARGPVDLPFLALVLLLTGIGLIMVFSASYASAYYDVQNVTGHNPTYFVVRQALFAAAGVACMWVISKMNYQYFRGLSIIVLGASIALLALVLVMGKEVNGARRWLNLGFQFQPSEVAKVGVILFFAARLAKRDSEKHKTFSKRTFTGRFLNFLDRIGFLELVPYIVVLGIVAVLLILEPHMSATILVFAIAASILFASGIRLGWFVAGGAVVVAALTFIINATDYMTRRIELWQNPWLEPQKGGFQTIQSLYAIGSGGLLGLGLGNSRQKFLYIPEPQNDYLFPIACEELGFIGAAMILILFALLIIRGYWLALHARDKFGALLIVGIITQVAVQVFLNIGVVTNLFPVTGISLPFFSYGGTALMIQLAEMGIVLSVARQIPAPRAG